MLLAKKFGVIAALGLLGVFAGCAGTEAPKPAELGPNAALIGVRQAWATQIGPVGFPLQINVQGNTITVASSEGAMAAVDARTGADIWRTSVGAGIAAGVGSDGRYAAVVTQGNELVVLDGGREQWRQKLSALSFTAPLVAGARVFVLSADRAVTAFDAASGRRLWTQSRPGEPLVLRQAGVIFAAGDTLIVGLSGRLVGMNPANGASRWEAPIAVPRGTNDVERLVDLVAQVSRVGDVVCARAYQTAIGCVNVVKGSLVWTKPANGFVGVNGDDQNVYGTEADGKVIAWRGASGDRAWESERLKYRGLTAPLAVGRSVAVGDGTGLIHLLSRDDGLLLNRLSTDGSAIVAAPMLAGTTLVVATRNGSVVGFRPE